MDYKEFFERKPEVVARELLGRTLFRESKSVAGRIIETGAYRKGKQTISRKGMAYRSGRIFLMPRRGYDLFNISTEAEGKPSCVEIRAIESNNKKIVGPGKMSKYFGLTPEFDNILFGTEFQLFGESVRKSKIVKVKGRVDNCLGYFSIKK